MYFLYFSNLLFASLMTKSLLIFLFILITCFVKSQNSTSYTSNFRQAVSDPLVCNRLIIDCELDNIEYLIKNQSLFPNLEEIMIINASFDAFSNSIDNLISLKHVVFINSNNLDNTQIFNQLSAVDGFNKLTYVDCNINTLPRNINKLKNLETLQLINCQQLNLKKIIDKLSRVENIKNLSLPVNSITEIPQNINKLKGLKSLNLRTNYLSDLPEELKELSELERINLENNLISNPLQSLSNLPDSSLKYISIDAGLNTDSIAYLKKIFPNAEIIELEKKEKDETLNSADTLLKNSNLNDKSKNIQNNDSLVSKDSVYINNLNQSAGISYGEFKTGSTDFKIYSTAYLHYAKMFNRDLLSLDFDTTCFNARFLDTNYINVWPKPIRPIAPNNTIWRIRSFFSKQDELSNNDYYGNFQFHFLRKANNNELWFDIFGKQNPVIRRFGWTNYKYFSKQQKEIMAFAGLVWVYNGVLDKKNFIDQFINQKFTDIRIYYDEPRKIFILKLKQSDGYITLEAYPRYKNKNADIALAQKTYQSRYMRYTNSLKRREQKFHQSLEKNWRRFKNNKLKYIEKQWKEFQKLYMSDEEKKLTRTQWLEYYDQVIANEKIALYNAYPTTKNLIRSFEIEDLYQNEYQGSDVYKDYYVDFYDSDSNKLVVVNYTIINIDAKTYVSHQINDFNEHIFLSLPQNDNIAIVLELRNGSTAIVNSAMLENKKNRLNYTIIDCKLLDKKIATVGQVVEWLKLY